MRFTKDYVEDWLKENDPCYGKNEQYMNNDRFRWVCRREISVNPLKMDQKSAEGRCCF